ncbi:MAG: sigma-70 family RNA polymerase sigma factor [Candidatus Acidiferrales bacterium]
MPPSPTQFVSLAMAESFLSKAAAPVRWNLTAEQFQVTLERSVARRFSSAPSKSAATAAAVEKYLESLHSGELALACACSAGNDAAWEYFVAEYRPQLHRAARAIAGESGAHELADSLFADLFGLREAQGMRRSLFDYFHGRSKLTTWLHAILAQRHVDEIRRTRKMEPLDDPEGEEGSDQTAGGVAKNDSPDPERAPYLAMLQAAVEAALSALEPRDRLRLAYYYVEELTLLEIGKLLGEHEATVSRKLERARQGLRRAVEAALREEEKLSEAQLRLCYEYAREEWPFDLTRALSARE